MYRLLHFLNLPVDVQEVCVFTAPLFSALTALSAYALASEVRGRGPGLVAASLAAVVPSYVSRSVAGSYDNEGVAIFALVTVFWLYVKTLKVRAERERGWEKGRTRKARARGAREKRKRKRTGLFPHLVLSRFLSDPTTAATTNTEKTKNADGLPRLGRGALAVLPLHGGVVGGVHLHHQPPADPLPRLRALGEADPEALRGVRAPRCDRHPGGRVDPGRGLQRRADERALRLLPRVRGAARGAGRPRGQVPAAAAGVRRSSEARGRRGRVLRRCRGGRRRRVRGREPDVRVDGEELVSGE